MAKIIISTIIMVLFYSSALAEVEVKLPEACQNKFKREVALKAKNWNALEAAAVKFIEGCDDTLGKDELAKANYELSLVLRSRNDYKNASIFADRAIFSSNEPEYHIEKAISLANLHRLKEAGLELDISELMAQLELKINRLNKIKNNGNDPFFYSTKEKHFKQILTNVKENRKKLNVRKWSIPEH